MEERKIILFDGVCNLCNRAVQFVLKHDHKNQFAFGSLQGKAGQSFLLSHHLSTPELHSFFLVEGERVYSRSSAALRVARHLGGAWALLWVFMVVPKFIRDAVYDWIARNRYRWFGKREECMIPTPALRGKFLD
jgi:predicted DCC family thiol-disulfide oxidoreductase YuxK